ncbi:MAG TPA: hypothetical protein VNT23_03320 [Gaiellaceae bacterium]|nr:hypothetical protein [Gaiellaceae bacterium]
MTETPERAQPKLLPSPEPGWKTAFREAKEAAEKELQLIHRESAERIRERLRAAS